MASSKKCFWAIGMEIGYGGRLFLFYSSERCHFDHQHLQRKGNILVNRCYLAKKRENSVAHLLPYCKRLVALGTPFFSHFVEFGGWRFSLRTGSSRFGMWNGRWLVQASCRPFGERNIRCSKGRKEISSQDQA